MSIGSRLKARREELNISVAAAAKAVGVAASTMYDLERGDQVSTTKLHLLCALYGLHPKFVEAGKGPRLIGDDTRKDSPQRIAEPAERYTLHRMQISPDEVEFGIEWGKLDEPARSLIRQQVMLLVANQVRKKRSGKKQVESDDRSSDRRQ